MADASLDERIRELYRGSPEEFIAARDALVRELKSAGDGDAAAAVKRLRKPTVPAWAVDQLASRDPSGIEALLDAGAEVRAAQQATLSSPKGADRLREATAARRRVVGELTRAAGEALAAAGIAPAAHSEEIRATLEHASIDDEVGHRLRTGTLERPSHGAAGVVEGFALQLVGEPTVEDGGEASAETAATSERASARELAARRREAERAAQTATRARATADRLAAEAEKARARLDDVAERHAAAERDALEAELRARRAADAVDEA